MAASAAPSWLLDADLAAQKHEEAVAVAVEKCADDTKGQTCYICTEALHWKTKEGLVRGCSCRGTAGFVHVSCLAEQAKILMDEVEENNLGRKAMIERWPRWYTCRLCEQGYHGVVACALGWACWKTYLGRPETDVVRRLAMNQLGNGLCDGDHDEDALSVREADLSTQRRLGDSEENLLVAQSNLALSYQAARTVRRGLRMRRDVYFGCLKVFGAEHVKTVHTRSQQLRGGSENPKRTLRRSQGIAAQNNARGATRYRRRASTHIQDEENLRGVALRGPCRHARRSPRGRDDSRGIGTDRAARARRRASDHSEE